MNSSQNPEDRQRRIWIAVFMTLIVLGVVGAIVGLFIEPWTFLIGALVAGGAVGTGAITDRHLQLKSARRTQYKQLTGRMRQLELEMAADELNDLRALEPPTPAQRRWQANRHTPAVRQFTSEYRRARTLWESLIGSDNNRVPSQEELTVLTATVNLLEDSYKQTQRVLEVGAEGLSAQRALEIRWGEQFRFPARSQLNLTEAAGPSSIISTVMNQMWPVETKLLARQMPIRYPGQKLTPGSVRSHIKALINAGLWRQDRAGFLWPTSVNTDDWGMYRTVTLGAHAMLRNLAPEEIANVLWEVSSPDIPRDRQQLFRAAQKRLGFLFFTGSNRQILNNALQVGLNTNRLALSPDGRILRGRQTWPSSYRRPVERWR